MGVEGALVQEILTIAEGFISENRVLEVKQLYREVRKHIQIEHKLLLAIINYMLEKRILVEGSKLTKELVLVNAHRKNIYEYIKSNGGVNFSAIQREYQGSTGSPGQLIWHLQVLLQFGYIKKLKFKRFTIFFPLELDADQALLTFLLRDALTRRLLKLLNTHESLLKTEFSQYLEDPRGITYYRLNILLEANLIASRGEDGKEIYINPQRKEAVANIISKLIENGGEEPDDSELDA